MTTLDLSVARTVRSLAAFTLLLLLAAGCTGDVPGARGVDAPVASAYDPLQDPTVNPPSLAEPYPGDDSDRVDLDATLIRHMGGDPTTLNPIFNIPWWDHYMHNLLFVNPFVRDQDLEWQVNPMVVESVEESDDQLTFTLRLRPELRWHDGEPWTAHDIVFSYEAIRDPQVPALFYKRNAERVTSVVALDDHTVQFTHLELLATRMRDMSFPVIPKHVFDVPAEREADPTMRSSEFFVERARRQITGSGRYRFVEWQSNSQVVVERWEEFPFEKPRFKRQVLKVVPDLNVALLLFRNEELHELPLTGQQFATQTVDEEFAAVGVKAFGPRRQVGSIGWNQDGSNPFFGDVRVRRAMSHAFDADRHVQQNLYGVYRRSRGIFDEYHWAHDPDIEAIPFDPARAAELLDEAGWITSDEDGWRYKEIEGEKVRLDFEIMMVPGVPSFRALADMFGSDLKKIGVSARPLFIENATLQERLREHDYDAFLNVVEVSNDPDEWGIYWSTAGYRDGYNWGGYSNSRVDELFEQARTLLTREERAPLYQEIQRITYEEQPNTWIYDYNLLWAFNKRLRGVQQSASGPILFWPGLNEWWMEKAP